MKIVLVHNTYQLAGGEDVVFRNESSLLKREGHEVIEYRRSNHDVSRFVSIGQIALAKQTIWASDTRREFRELLKREKPDVVHVHNTFVRISPSIYWACRDAGVPVVQTLHNYRLLCPGANLFREGKVCEECVEGGLWRGVQHACYRNSRPATAVVAAMLATHRVLGTWSREIDFYLVPTQFARGKFIAGGLPSERIGVKANFVHPDPGEGRGERNYALYVGRLSPEKGVHTLLAAWKRTPSSIPLEIVGDGPLRAELEGYAREHGLANVTFRGNLTWNEAMAAMQKARCLILPSECYEGALPLTVVEAFACGTPVIASRLGAMQDLISDGRTGLQFHPGDSTDLASKVAQVWSNPSAMVEMSRLARREYEANYTANVSYKILMDIYERAIRNSNASHAEAAGNLLSPVWRMGRRRQVSKRVPDSAA
ncbi:MAG: glycosyltransferase [Candidatus Acidiferrales bacterium]